ncbi:unnamed protein product [Linum tenue]|uniref:F-box domain-containing protein n=1 Tax=Linum tenue TaxID=586396 RepID=A0AAV0NIS7_9ROSI|nr:unnamed protein product [Linum tenue]
MKALLGCNADRISNLPHDVMQRIITFLPVKDAAKTAALSKQWRHNWGATTQLVFDAHFGRISKEGNYDSNVSRLMLQIYKALLVHDGPITKFVLEIPGLRRPSPDINHMVQFLAKKGVHELTLIFDDDEVNNGQTKVGREMPSSLFSARQLSFLKMRNCDFSWAPSWFLGFTKLTHLWLVSVNVDSSFYDDFLPKCPLLEHLTLGVRDSNAIESCLKAELVAPSLKFLASNVWNICFKHTPLLSVVSIEPLYEDYTQCDFRVYDPDIAAVFASLPAIQHLSVGGEWLQFFASGTIPSMLPTHLRQLTLLEVASIELNSSLEARVLLCLIMSSPNLQRLRIWVGFKCLIEPSDAHSFRPTKFIDSLQLLIEAEDFPPASYFQCLEEFDMYGCDGAQVELDLVRLVLTSAPRLRRVFLTMEEDLDYQEGFEFLTKVTRYKRASTEAEVICV